jgi:hypothetical protein
VRLHAHSHPYGGVHSGHTAEEGARTVDSAEDSATGATRSTAGITKSRSWPRQRSIGTCFERRVHAGAELHHYAGGDRSLRSYPEREAVASLCRWCRCKPGGQRGVGSAVIQASAPQMRSEDFKQGMDLFVGDLRLRAVEERLWALGYYYLAEDEEEPGSLTEGTRCLECTAKKVGRAPDGLVNVPPREPWDTNPVARPVSVPPPGMALPGKTFEESWMEVQQDLLRMKCKECGLLLCLQACTMMCHCGLRTRAGIHSVST